MIVVVAQTKENRIPGVNNAVVKSPWTYVAEVFPVTQKILS